MKWVKSVPPSLFKAAQVIAGSCFLIGLVKVLALAFGTGIDYTMMIRVVTLKWLNGQTRLFDQNSLGYYNLPWSLWLFVPTVWFPTAIGQACLSLLTLVGVCVAVAVFGQALPLWIKVMAATPFCLLMLLLAGNIDGILLLGFGLSWWAVEKFRPYWLAIGLWLAMLKPVNSIPLLVCILFPISRWSWTNKFKALSVSLFSLLMSFPLFGWDWPVRYVRNYNVLPPVYLPIVTLWKFSDQFGLPRFVPVVWSILLVSLAGLFAKREGFKPLTFAHVLAVWMLITPYALDTHYVLLIPACLIVARYSKGLAVLSHSASFLPLLRLRFGFDVISIDLLYPFLIWVSTLFIMYFKYNDAAIEENENRVGAET